MFTDKFNLVEESVVVCWTEMFDVEYYYVFEFQEHVLWSS
jgi:hypothetical protein